MDLFVKKDEEHKYVKWVWSCEMNCKENVGMGLCTHSCRNAEPCFFADCYCHPYIPVYLCVSQTALLTAIVHVSGYYSFLITSHTHWKLCYSLLKQSRVWSNVWTLDTDDMEFYFCTHLSVQAIQSIYSGSQLSHHDISPNTPYLCDCLAAVVDLLGCRNLPESIIFKVITLLQGIGIYGVFMYLFSVHYKDCFVHSQ